MILLSEASYSIFTFLPQGSLVRSNWRKNTKPQFKFRVQVHFSHSRDILCSHTSSFLYTCLTTWSVFFCHIYFLIKNLLKVSKFQNEFMKSSFLPKYEPKIVKISALSTYSWILVGVLLVIILNTKQQQKMFSREDVHSFINTYLYILLSYT